MFRVFLFLQITMLVSACNTVDIVNINNKLIFSHVESDFTVTDRNNYQCEKIDKKIIKHVLLNGIEVTNREIHDHYSTSGCTVEGSIVINQKKEKFSFDYGGYITIGNNLIIGCAKECCKNNFKYCTWEPNGLK